MGHQCRTSVGSRETRWEPRDSTACAIRGIALQWSLAQSTYQGLLLDVKTTINVQWLCLNSGDKPQLCTWHCSAAFPCRLDQRSRLCSIDSSLCEERRRSRQQLHSRTPAPFPSAPSECCDQSRLASRRGEAEPLTAANLRFWINNCPCDDVQFDHCRKAHI